MEKTFMLNLLHLSLSIFVVSISVLLFMMRWRRRSRQTQEEEAAAKKYNLPPGSFGWPLVGEGIQFMFGSKDDFVRERVKKYSSNIFKTNIFGIKVVVLCGPSELKYLFANDSKMFSLYIPRASQKILRTLDETTTTTTTTTTTVEAATANNAFPTSDETKVVRQSGYLKPQSLSRFIGEMDRVTQDFLKSKLGGDGEKEIISALDLFNSLTLLLSCRFIIGADKSESGITKLGKQFQDALVGIQSLPVDIPGTAYRRALRSADKIDQEFKVLIKEKKDAAASGKPMKDVLSHMLLLPDLEGKYLSEEEISRKAIGLVLASNTTIGRFLSLLIKHVGLMPHVYHQIRKEQMEIAASKEPGALLTWEDIQKMKYTWNALNETMRVHTAGNGYRNVLTDVTLGDYTIPKGWKVYWSATHNHSNNAYFPEAEKFDPSRFEKGGSTLPPFTFAPFGSGPRLCPGREYARMVMLTAVHHFVKMYKWEVLLPDEKVLTVTMPPAPQKGVPIRVYPL